MHYIAIAIFDSENISLKDKIDMINSKTDKELNELRIKSIGKKFDEIIDIYIIKRQKMRWVSML